MKVFLSGEERTSWVTGTTTQVSQPPPATGLIEALLLRAAAARFVVVGARVWKSIRKFVSGPLEPRRATSWG